MRYYRNIDYYLYFEEFPHMGISGVIVSNSDGTANIYINTLYSEARQRETIRHELRHLVRQHQYDDRLTLEEKEAEAEEEDPCCRFGEDFSYAEYCPELEVTEEKAAAGGLGASGAIPDLFKEAPPGKIPYFASLESMKRYIEAMREQHMREYCGSGRAVRR